MGPAALLPVQAAATDASHPLGSASSFKPGHLHRGDLPGLSGQRGFTPDLHCQVHHDEQAGTPLQFRLLGEVDGERFEETFALHRDTACTFASVLSRIAAEHGLPPESGPILREHAAFGSMFEDLRGRLQVGPGEPVDLDPPLKDGR